MNETITVSKVTPRSPEEREFIDLPFTIFSGNPYFVPNFEKETRQVIAREHPFFYHSEGEFFIARRGTETVGRIALLEPHRFNSYRGKKDARFCYFDVKDDIEAAKALFRHAEQWARTRGLNRLIGPQYFSSFSGSGVLVQGFQHTASMTMMPYHHPYYHELLEQLGFSKYKDFYSARIDATRTVLPYKYERVAKIARTRGNFTVRTLSTKRELRVIGREIGRIYNDSWEDHDEFRPMTNAELDQMVHDLELVTDPSLVKVIEREGELAGFILAFPDLSPALIKARGKPNIFDLFSIMRLKRRTDRFLINGLGILPQYRKIGGLAILFHEINQSLRAHRVREAEMTQIAETTDLMLSHIEKLGAEVYKVHRVYQKSVG
jgi:GNAT superfamily N-acetyltransferase